MRPTTDQSKRAAGTYRPILARPPLGVPLSMPQPPAWLSTAGLVEWEALVPVLYQSGVLVAIDATGLAIRCELVAEYAENPRGFSAGKLKELRMLSAEFGCSVSSRLKLKAPEGTTAPEPDKCPPSKDDNVVSFSDRLSTTRKALLKVQSTPADTSSTPVSDN